MIRNDDSDILIAGGGLVGLTLGIGLAQQGIRVTIVDALDPNSVVDVGFDGRCSAIAHASAKMLDGIGVWSHLADDAQPIEEIRVSDRDSLLHLHFDYRELGDEPLGYMVENRHNRKALQVTAAKLDQLNNIAPDAVVAHGRQEGRAWLETASGRRVSAPLLIAADGRGSAIREREGIRITRKRYPADAIVAAIEHEIPHFGIAHERFQSVGPFAILPMTQNRSSLVWTVASDMTKTVMGLSDRAFSAEIEHNIGDFLGDITVLPRRWSYPLSLHYAERYVDDRLALIGDAAHGIHPIAGQGLNMGLRDVAALIEVLVDAARTGQDLGSPQVLEHYQRWRRTDNLVLAAVTNGLNSLFATDNRLVRLARDVGLAAVHRLPPARRFFMSHARGSFGTDIPRLLKGEAV